MDAEMRQAFWVYTQVCRRLEMPIRKTFETEYLNSWAEYYFYAAGAKRCSGSNDFPPKRIYLAWHQPEAPRLMAWIARLGALTLLAQQARWMVDLMGEGNTLLFRSRGSLARLMRSLKGGQPVACMFDYCYAETASVDAMFLGFSSRTPSGLLTLAARFGYELVLVSYLDGDARIVATVDAAGQPPKELASLINHHLQQQILRDPSRWLLWPSLNSRWSAQA
ncbi:hypothetical protein BA011_32315 (plasmid) [Rhizobium leguminosarum]|uniref:Uncharacterized protein n=1 Tax=Rhizobium leguminosarum TaxID=384 RepID=A0A1B1CLE6_RHILE|nr:hypothetical protein BA011_32315 [Rhizobium leguminosarum]